jgi:hypothetical protein
METRPMDLHLFDVFPERTGGPKELDKLLNW